MNTTPSAELCTTVHYDVIERAERAEFGTLVLGPGAEYKLSRWDAEIIRRSLSKWFHAYHLYVDSDANREAFTEPAELLHAFLTEELYRTWISRADTPVVQS